MNANEEGYLDLLRLIMRDGKLKIDRTGVGTKGIFGAQLRFDLRESFPLLTTKKVFFRAVVEELLWFLSGSTNVKPLQDKGIHIWSSWQDEFGSIGPGYGKQWRRWETIEYVKPVTFDAPAQTLDPKLVAGVGTCGAARQGHEEMYSIWNEMLHRCYDKTKQSYRHYGAKGVHVHQRWFDFAAFLEDVQKLDGWLLKCAFHEEYSLDKDYKAANRYGPDTCIWASQREQRINTTRSVGPVAVTLPSGQQFTTMDIAGLCLDYGLDESTVYKCIKGQRTETKGVKLAAAEVTTPSETVARIRLRDQIAEAVARIRFEPQSRRIIVSAWNAAEVDRTKLPPCHSFFQFHVMPREDGEKELSCHMYQRSADMFLGVPFNIASYALLTKMVAHVCQMHPGDLVISYGDAHIYNNHIPQVTEQLSRVPRAAPKLSIIAPTDYPLSIDDFKFEHFALMGYDPHPAIKGEVAV